METDSASYFHATSLDFTALPLQRAKNKKKGLEVINNCSLLASTIRI